MRCHLGVAPQERTAEEHTTRGQRKTRATFRRVISGGMVSRGWSLWTVLCEGGTYPARISTTNASRRRSSTSYLPESMDADRAHRSAATNGKSVAASWFSHVSDPADNVSAAQSTTRSGTQ